MPPHPIRPSLCLFCAHAFAQAPRRLAPLVQIAYESTVAKPARTGKHSARSRSGFDSFHNPRSGGRGHRHVAVSKELPLITVEETVNHYLDELEAEMREPHILGPLKLDTKSFDRIWSKFKLKSLDSVWNHGDILDAAKKGKGSLVARLRYNFYADIYAVKFTKAEVDNQRDLADLRYPGEWYPGARTMVRTIHLHVGPTNSGKTYHALKRLEEAAKGVYLGPLRLLAHEVYSRLNAKGIPCALVTGEEKRIPEGEYGMSSCTVEMAPLQAKLDVAVIDEIQMINHDERGWAWTAALMGLQATEIHVCGEERAVPLVREICASLGDQVVVHKYERLSPLQVAKESLGGDLSQLQKGDCVVAFSIMGIHALRKEIEKSTGRKVAIVYGSLPPETRAAQAKLFNDPDNEYDFLVASDAIGMGLNLSIKRIIFEAMTKSDGQKLVPLQVSDVKQIAGRAGRYKTAAQAVTDAAEEAEKEDSVVAEEAEKETFAEEAEKENSAAPLSDGTLENAVKPFKPKTSTVGYVTTLEGFDFPMMKEKMALEAPPIVTAGLFPPALIIERFASYFPPGTPFSFIITRLHEIADTHERFHHCNLRDITAIADAIQSVDNLSTLDRLVFCASPANMRNPDEMRFIRFLAECVAEQKTGSLLDLPYISLSLLDEEPSGSRKFLQQLEKLHKMIVLYLWLTYRFPNVFTTRSLAEYTKVKVEDYIERCLRDFSYTPAAIKAAKRKRLQELVMQKMKDEGMWGPHAEASPKDDLGEYPADVIDHPNPTMAEILHGRRNSRVDSAPSFGDIQP